MESKPTERSPGFSGVYVVTRESADTRALLGIVSAALDGGAALVQYRDKSHDASRRRAQALALVALCTRFAVPCVINDDAELAAAVGAAGVHLGRNDRSIAALRRESVCALLIGASCYADVARANAAVASGADYVAFGSIYPSPTKPDASRAALEVLRAARAAALGVPIVAIGGISVDNAAAVIDAGADLVAVSSVLFDSIDPRATTAALDALFR